MATDLERLVVTLEARTKEYERALARAQQVTVGQLRRIEGAVTTSSRRMEARLGAAGSILVRTFSGLLAGFSAREIIGAADSFTRIENAIRLTGREGEELTSTMEALFDAARRNGAPVESLAQLYSRLGQVQGELGIKSEELISFTDNVAAAIRVSGRTAEQSSGALLQFAQALGSGTVRAEEFNSILEGALPIAQAAARGLDAAGGSVAKLRQLVIDGQVSSKEFFDAFQRGAVQTQEQARNMELTVGQAWQSIATAAVEAIGKMDERLRGSSSLAAAMQFFAESLNIVSDAITRQSTQAEQITELEQRRAGVLDEILNLQGQITARQERGLNSTEEQRLKLQQWRDLLTDINAQLDAYNQGIQSASAATPPALPSVTRGVDQGPPSADVQQIADAIEGAFARQAAEIQAIQRILQEGNISAGQRAILMERLATLQAAINGTVSKDATLRAVGGQITGAVAQIPVANQSMMGGIQGAISGLESAIDGSGENVAGAVQAGANQTSTAVREMAVKVSDAVSGKVNTESLAIEGNREAAAIQNRLEQLQAELQVIQTAQQFKELTPEEQREADLRVAEIQLEMAKLNQDLVTVNQAWDEFTTNFVALLNQTNGELLAMLGPSGLLQLILQQWASIFGNLDLSGASFAGGGAVRGPGTSRSDSIPAMLSNGEFVVNAAQAKKHRGLLESINSGNLLGRFSDGGLVARLNSSVQRLQSGGIAQRMPESTATSRDSGGKTTNISINLTGTDLQSIRGSERAMARKFAREIAYELEQL